MKTIARHAATALATLALAGTATAVAHTTGDGVPAVGVGHSPRVCFAATKWGPAPDWQRPCVQITNVEEDGSFGYRVTDAAGSHPTMAPAVRYSSGVGALDR